MAERDAIVVVDCGSDVVKLHAVTPDGRSTLWWAAVFGVGTNSAVLSASDETAMTRAVDDEACPGVSVDEALAMLWARMKKQALRIQAIGHRVPHGGETFTEPVVIDDALLQALEHAPPVLARTNVFSIQGIRLTKRWREQQTTTSAAPHIAVFDTGFHATLAPVTTMAPVPRRLCASEGFRRYGFHGSLHRYVAERAAAFFARPLSSLRLVTVALDHESSACAIDHGRSMDTTSGMTPLSGLMAATSSGDVDAAMVLRLAELLGVAEAERVLRQESGFAGTSVAPKASVALHRTDEPALDGAAHPLLNDELATRMFSLRVKKAVGALACAMGGLDGIVFTGSLGVNAPQVRALVCDGLRVVGALLHEQKNAARSSAERDLSTMDSRVRILVIPSARERVLALDVVRFLEARATPAPALSALPSEATTANAAATQEFP